MKSSREESFDMALGGRDVCVEFLRITMFVHDAHYGADADGNRGMTVDFIDEDCPEDVMVSWDDDLTGPDKTRTVALHTLPDDQRVLVNAAIDAYLEEVPPTPEEEPERDWDRVNDERRDRKYEPPYPGDD